MAGKIQNAVAAKQENSITNEPAKKSVTVLMNSLLDSEGYKKRFNELLGARSPQFVSSLISLVNADANLQRAFYEAPVTIIQSALKAATFDLPIDPNLGYAYIVPFNNYNKDSGKKRMEATFIMGWKGMNQLALRTGVYETINVVDVREGELKRYDRLTEEIDIEFIEDEDERDSLPIIGWAGYYRLINGTKKTIFMTRKQIENHEKRFRKGQYMGKGWRENFDDMAAKTVFRKLIGKFGLMSINYQTADKATIAAAEALATGKYDDEDTAPVVSEDVIEVPFSDFVEDGEEPEFMKDEAIQGQEQINLNSEG